MTTSEATVPVRPGSARRALPAVPAVRWIGAVVIVALGLRLVYGPGAVGYDSFYALFWGDQLADGGLPTYDVPHAPTPHPLANLVGALLSPLGHGAMTGIKVIATISLATLIVLCFALGRRLFGVGVGLLFAGLVATRTWLLNDALSSSVDIPFLCLAVGALLLILNRPKARYSVLALLLPAGLLRPEAWLFAGVFILWRWRDSTPRERSLMIAMAAIAPAIWVGSDAIITGNPGYSFGKTRLVAESSGRQGGVLKTILWTPRAWYGILHLVPAIAAVVGLVAGLRFLPARTRPPAVLVVLGSVSFLATGFSGLPLLIRFFLLSGIGLCLFAAVGILGWQQLPEGSRERTLWARVGAVLAVALVLSIPFDASNVSLAVGKNHRLNHAQLDLQRLAHSRLMRVQLRSCTPLVTRNYRARPELIFLWHDGGPKVTIIATTSVTRATRGLLLRYKAEKIHATALGFRQVASNRSWTLLEHCRP